MPALQPFVPKWSYWPARVTSGSMVRALRRAGIEPMTMSYSELAAAMMSIPAVKGVSIGMGFEAARRRGLHDRGPAHQARAFHEAPKTEVVPLFRIRRDRLDVEPDAVVLDRQLQTALYAHAVEMGYIKPRKE